MDDRTDAYLRACAEVDRLLTLARLRYGASFDPKTLDLLLTALWAGGESASGQTVESDFWAACDLAHGKM